MSAEDIGSLLNVERVVFAARDRAEASAFEASLRTLGFGGAVVSWDAPRRPSIEGRAIGVVLSPRSDGEAVLAAMKAAGCRVVMLLGPVAGAREDAARDRRRLSQHARRLELRLIGPSRLGIISPGHRLALSQWSPLPAAGTVGVLTRSDSLGAALLAAMEREGVGLSHLVSLGESDDAGMADILDAFALDPQTRAILLHVHRMSDPRPVLSALRSACRTKAVVALRSGAALDTPPAGRTALSKLVLHHRVIDAALARAGVVKADTLEAMADVAEMLGHARPLTLADTAAPPRIAIVSNGSGAAGIAADAALAEGAALAGSGPLDLGAEAKAADFAAAVEPLVAARAADVVIVLRWPVPGCDPAPFAEAIAGIARKRTHYRPAHIVVGLLGGERDRDAQAILRERGVPAYETPERAVVAALGEIAHARRRAALMRLPESLAEEARQWVPNLSGWARARLAGQSEPLVLEAAAAQPLLDILELDLAPSAAPPAGATSLTFGLGRDPVFGPVLVMAPATRIEPDAPSAIALPPLDASLARLALSELRLGRVLLHREPDAADAVVARLVLLAEIASEVPAVAEVMLEGVRLSDGKLQATGIGVVLDPAWANAPPGTGMALPRYPRELASIETLPGGLRVLLRPIRPEDARHLQRLFGKMTPEDRRMRLFVPVRELADALAARLTQIDYEREMCLIAEDPDQPGEILAGARIVCDPDGEEAEYAVSVRSDRKGLGLGRLVLTRIFDHARRRGIKRVWGSVLAENHGMLGLADQLGLRRESSPEGPDIVKTVLELAP